LMRIKRVYFLIVFILITAITKGQDLLYLSGSGAQPNLFIQAGGQVYVQGGFVANAASTGIKLNGELHLKDGSTSTNSHWTDNSATTTIISGSTGTVYLESAFLQNVSALNTVFYNLVFNNSSVNSSGIQLLSNVVVSNQADFRDGVVYANANTFRVSNSAATGIIYSAPNTSSYPQSWVVALYSSGKLDRDMTNSASTYAFPVGSSAAPQLLEVIPVNITGISRFSASWENGVVGTSPILISECSTNYMIVNSAGEWHLRPANGGVPGAGSFAAGQITLYGHGLTSFPGLIDNQFAMLTRAQGNSTAATWTVPVPSCSSLSAPNTAGRTVASDYASRINLTAWSDNTSQAGIGMTSVPLPIELLSFSGYSEEDKNELLWSTASEINSDHFDIERSTTGEDFMLIGKENAAGWSVKTLQYHFSDFLPPKSISYYRLKLVDKDDQFKYSDVITLETIAGNGYNVSLYPNPAVDYFVLHIQSATAADLLVELSDAMGRLLTTSPFTIAAGITTYSADIKSLSPATYLVRVFNLDNSSIRDFKLIKSN
jgi:hypothetical protein